MLRIKEVLKKKKVSQIELAEMLDITTVGINKIINGNPTAETLQKIAEVLDVDIRDLFEPTKEATTEPIYLKRDGDFIEIGSLNLKG
ncbi:MULTISPECIES: helix-turn-helix domain-containing protein [unclassified Kaistella]|uniref:helix-turn-helix domain-containing protein n=1 Tax=unclassified Kaistella TaxID=2762626 RepID=UPI0027349D84|nr:MULTISPECIES: helix-turn-helix transcriptional regulator [unclassified Kaistella]MDP2452650.1 helix-turn-helix transcriptional regulator [Kaistella sp. SH11-4b]MDP2455559.1 helix-turn-helix transcriptional regulator [Kaistella sp. SH40-3]MDP2458463.1 helix-turn-helix transcriptional regulator [Kaistella sp. SH19-2b]